MKVLLVNGSPPEKGCTYTALSEIARVLQAQGIETEIFQLGKAVNGGCRACLACRTLGKCVVDDSVNEFALKAESADGFVFGSPVHYASAGGNIVAFMDRLFYSSSRKLMFKPAACIASCRRGGATATFDVLNKYFTINQMPVVSSNYWTIIHGNTAEEAAQDIEGMQTARVLGNNMAWLLKCIEAGKAQGIEPQKEKKILTNFIR